MYYLSDRLNEVRTQYCLWSCLTDAVRRRVASSRTVRGTVTSKTHFQVSPLSTEWRATGCSSRRSNCAVLSRRWPPPDPPPPPGRAAPPTPPSPTQATPPHSL